MQREYPQAPIVGVGAVVVDHGRVLVARRGREPLKGEWSLPGGALEVGETLEEGVVREVREECGLEVAPVAVVEVLDRIVRDDDGRVRYHYVLVDFLCRFTGGTLACASDALDARWIAHEEWNSHSVYRLEPRTLIVIEKAVRMAAECGL
ncbi:MAG TPA: NUDIX hydrolase [Acidobacteriaceae bacterium]|jgi:mutator protein MutT|nr:NUDIX hydrolase [Acidobacteriaceae bacterium]